MVAIDAAFVSQRPTQVGAESSREAPPPHAQLRAEEEPSRNDRENWVEAGTPGGCGLRARVLPDELPEPHDDGPGARTAEVLLDRLPHQRVREAHLAGALRSDDDTPEEDGDANELDAIDTVGDIHLLLSLQSILNT